MKLTRHFSLEELARTDVRRFAQENLLQATRRISKLNVIALLLESVRREWTAPIRIHSGYRYSALNAAVGGVSNSQHMLAEAVDFSPMLPVPKTHARMLSYFARMVAHFDAYDIMFGQAIFEADDNKLWIHLSLGAPFRKVEDCRQVLFYENGKYKKVKQLPVLEWM